MRIASSLILLLVSASAYADTYVVTKTADTNDGSCDADCSLREAVDASNRRMGPDVIRLQHAFYRLTVEVAGPGDSQLQICDEVVIRGAPDRSTIDANLTNRHFELCADAKVEMIDLTLRNGRGVGVGGSILNSGELTLRRTWVIGNQVVPSDVGQADGGGIYNLQLLRIVEGRIERNVSLGSTSGAGNRGGGIYNNVVGRLFLYDTLVRGNVTGEDDSVGYGAGIYNGGGQALVVRSFFGANDPGDGEGGAIANRYGGSLKLVNSTLSNNGHDGANGALANGTTIDVAREAEFEPPSATVLESTIANNNGGGLLNTGRTTLRNTIVAGNYSQDGHDRYYDTGRNCLNEGDGTITQTHAIVGAPSNCPAHVYVDNHRVFETLLDHLRYLGGPSPVHKPKDGSAAIDGGSDTCDALDQRRQPRPADGDGDGVAVCDVGAMEVQPDE
jgi:CSLREA domain-containing protein